MASRRLQLVSAGMHEAAVALGLTPFGHGDPALHSALIAPWAACDRGHFRREEEGPRARGANCSGEGAACLEGSVGRRLDAGTWAAVDTSAGVLE